MTRLTFTILWLFSGIAVAAEPSFTPLPDLPGGAVGTFVTALSANGEVAVGFSSGATDLGDPLNYPFRWTRDGGMVALSQLQGSSSGVSADGSVVVGRVSVPGKPNPSGAFRWTAGTGIVTLEGVTKTGSDAAYSVSDDGRFVAGTSSSGPLSESRAVRWVDGGSPMELGAETTLAVFVSADGTVAAGTRTDGPIFDAFRWTAAEGAVSLEGLPGRPGGPLVRDMTPDGRVIVGNHGGGFVWTPEKGMLEIAGFSPYAVSDNGLVMAGIGGGRTSIWTEATGALELQPFLTGLGLDLTGWRLTEIQAISGDGTTIAGHGIPPDPSMSGAWVATIPEPSTWLLGGIALSAAPIGVLLRRRRALMGRS
ncbi:MAG: hypothetical protein WD894_06085 [Pirellulales bacterium]